LNQKPVSKFAAIVQPPVFPKTLHQSRPAPEVVVSAKPPKGDNTFPKSRGVREDPGTRAMKTAHNDQANYAR